MKSSLSFAVREKEKKETVALPEEVLMEILLRSPAKSLMRYKYVSKRWLSLITSRYFTNLYLKSSSRRRFFACIVDYERRSIFEKKEKNSDEYVLLTSSSHDHSVSVMDQNLMPRMGGYFVNTVRGLACFRIGTRVQVCNVHTRQVVELPIIRCEAIGYDKAVCYNNVWNCLGHDPVRDEYKVLSLVWEVTKEHRFRSEHHVFVLGAGASWRKTQCRIPHHRFQFYSQSSYSRGVSINGVLYYEAWTHEDTHVLISFDLSSEEFDFIELPNVRNFHLTGLINYKGKVAVFDYTSVLRYGVMDFWVIEDDDKGLWSDQKTFALPVYHMDIDLDGYNLKMGGTCCSGMVWLIKAPLTPNQSTEYVIYDVGRNEIIQRIEIKPSLLGSFKDVNWLLSTFWDDIENIMYLEI